MTSLAKTVHHSGLPCRWDLAIVPGFSRSFPQSIFNLPSYDLATEFGFFLGRFNYIDLPARLSS